jgi:hypothetical protein
MKDAIANASPDSCAFTWQANLICRKAIKKVQREVANRGVSAASVGRYPSPMASAIA